MKTVYTVLLFLLGKTKKFLLYTILSVIFVVILYILGVIGLGVLTAMILEPNRVIGLEKKEKW